MENTTQKNSLFKELVSLLTNKNLLIVMLMLTCNSSATNLSKTCINVYGKGLGTTVAILGFIATLNGWGKIICRPFSGRGVDKFDPRNWMIFCCLLRMLTYILFAVSNSVALFGIGRLLEGVTNALMVTSLYSLTGLCVTKAQIGTAMALYSFFPSLFTAVAIQVSTSLFEIGPKIPFYGSVAMLAIMCVLSFFLRMPARNAIEAAQAAKKEKAQAQAPKREGKFRLSDYIAFEGLWFLPMMWANSAHLASEDLLVVVYATDLGIAASGALYFSISTLVKMWAAVPIGALADRIGAKWVIFFGFACKAAGFILLAVHPAAVSFLVAGILRGLALPMQNVMQAQAIKIMPKSKMGIANSTHLLITDFGVMFMSSLAGIVCARSGIAAAFMIFGGIAALGIIFYALLSKKIETMAAEAVAADEASSNAAQA